MFKLNGIYYKKIIQSNNLKKLHACKGCAFNNFKTGCTLDEESVAKRELFNCGVKYIFIKSLKDILKKL